MKKFFVIFLMAICLSSCDEKLVTRVVQAYTDGSVKTEADFLEDEKTKVYQRTYQEDGKLLFEGPIKNDKRDGEWKFYFFDGKLKSSRNYQNGKYSGEYEEFYPNGNMKMKGAYLNGNRTGNWLSYDENGNLTTDIKEPDLETKEVIEKNVDGSVKSEIIYAADGVTKEQQLSYHDTGELMLKGFFKNNKKDGKWVSYFKNGNIQSINNYLNGQFHGDYSVYKENGQAMIQGEYNEGYQTGMWFSYDETGKLISQKFYDHEGTLLEEIK